MHDTNGYGEPLALQALLYATGELDAPEEAAFEQRLGEDQQAREALCQAVRLSSSLAGRRVTGPGPAYRQRVQSRLRRVRGAWGWLVGRHPYRGHPLVWIAVGAVAAVVLLLVSTRLSGFPSCPGAAPRAPATQDVAEVA